MRTAFLRTAAALSILLTLAGRARGTAAASQAPSLNDGPIIARLVGRDGTLTISATGHGPAYSVADQDGKALLTRDATADLARIWPGVERHVGHGVAKAGDDDDTAKLDASIDVREAW